MGNQGVGNSEGPGAERREAPPASGLPCLSRHNSTGKVRAYAVEWGGTIVHTTAEFEREQREVAARDLMYSEWGGKAAELVAQVACRAVARWSESPNPPAYA